MSKPEMSDRSVSDATGHGWDHWCTQIKKWPGHVDGHAAIATHLQAEHGLDGWWAQSVTVGFERITGIRLPHQMSDGTFTANKSRTMAVDYRRLRELLLNDEARSDLFPGQSTELKSKPDAKSIRLTVGPGTAQIALDPSGDRTRVTVQHSRLPTFDDVEHWKTYWTDWLDALEAESSRP